MFLLIIIIVIIITTTTTAVEFSPGGSSPDTSTDKTKKNKCTYTKQCKNSTKNTQHSKYKYTYYQNTHKLQKKLK